MFYRWLATQKDDSNREGKEKNGQRLPAVSFSKREPIYPTFSGSTDTNNIKLVPLFDDMDTMLIESSSNNNGDEKRSGQEEKKQSPSTFSSISLSLPLYQPERDGTYCGDFQQNWEKAYKFGKAGNFQKCFQLYQAQKPNVSFSPSFSSVRLPTSSSTNNNNTQTTLITTDLLGKQAKNTIQLEQDAVERKIKMTREEIEDAKKKYLASQQELLSLQLVPFLRP
jgi:hypothetical protein